MKPKFSVFLVAVALCLGGCENVPASAPANAGAPSVYLIPAAKINALARGMSAEKVRELLGAPRAVRPFAEGGPTAEIWSYRIGFSESVRPVPVSMQDIPVYDPLTGQAQHRPEAVYRNQRVVVYQTLELLMLDGLLAERKPGTEVERSYD